MRETVKITFPNNQGISGKVFHKNEIFYSNEVSKEYQFTGDIDNLTGIKDVRNFLIGPVYPHPTTVRGE